MTHTQGPLFVDDESSPYNLNVVARVGQWYICVPDEIPFGNDKDDAALFAAAPELLAACEALYTAILEWSEDLSPTNQEARLALLQEARAAIAKARG